MTVLKYLSLFSGIGGFEVGLENSVYNFECIGYSEIDKFAKGIYQKHFPKHFDLGDAREIRAEELPDFDLLVGGFPCQAFSLSGKRKGFDDTRGTLFFEIARICAEKKPRYLLLENVKGLLSHDGGRTYKKMLGILAELGYDVEWQVYNSKSYGVPQNRERLYIKGYFRAKCGGEILSAKRGCREVDVRLMPFKFNRQVKKRLHSVDYGELSSFLRQHKKAADATVKDISEKLGKSKSEVEHWFRSDDFFSPPSDDVWFDLKDLLGITDDKYDAFITEFEWVDGVYDMDKRAYSEEGISSTITTNKESLVKINVVGNLSNTGHRGDNVLDTTGVSSTLTACNYKHPIKIIEKSDNPKVVGNVYPNGHWSGNVYDLDHIGPTMMGQRSDNVVRIKEPLKLKTNTAKGYDEVVDGDGVRLCHPTSKIARGRSQKGLTGALSTRADWGTLDKDYRIRRLTPLECERLQAFPDGWTLYDMDDKVVSDTQRYKCLGNAVTTSVVTHIANNMFGGYFEGKGTD